MASINYYVDSNQAPDLQIIGFLQVTVTPSLFGIDEGL
jgi:hypothetical protein